MDQQTMVPITIYQGETFAPPAILWIDANRTPVNISGFTAKLMARETVNGANPPVIDARTSNGLIVITGATGSIQIILGPTFTAALPAPFEGVWDLFVYSAAGVATRLVGGTICIKEPVTR